MENKKLRALAFDCGSSNGRIMAGDFDGSRLAMTELSRFPNTQEEMGGTRYWNVMRMWQELKLGIRKATSQSKFDSISTDCWGADFVVLRKDGQLLQNVIGYRDEIRIKGHEEVNAIIKPDELNQKVGVHYFSSSAAPILRYVNNNFPGFLDYADVLLNLPDYFNYLLSGEKCSEFTIASTNQLMDPRTNQYHPEVLKILGLPGKIFLPPELSGRILGKIRPALEKELGFENAKVIASCGHDSAAALAAVPVTGDEDWMCISSGSWSVIMSEIDKPYLYPGNRYYGFFHEGAYGGSYRICYNLIGLYIIQELRRVLGSGLSYDEIDSMAVKEKPYRSIMIPQNYQWVTKNLTGTIQDYCRNTGQPVPETGGELARCIYDSIALNSAVIIKKMENLTGKNFKRIHVVGGGTMSTIMLQGIADITGKEVVSGPKEATAIGNIVVQLIALGELSDLNEGRRLIKESFNTRSYFPSGSCPLDIDYYTREMYDKTEFFEKR